MGSRVRGTHVGGALAVVGAAVLLHSGILGNRGAQPLRVDHTKRWSYVRVPHRPATELERRLGDVAGLVARRPVQVRCEDFSDGTPLEPGGVVQFNGKQPADFARIRPDVCTRLLRFISAPRGAYACIVRRSCDTSIADTAQALTVLAHESIHLRGVRNEGCHAVLRNADRDEGGACVWSVSRRRPRARIAGVRGGLSTYAGRVPVGGVSSGRPARPDARNRLVARAR